MKNVLLLGRLATNIPGFQSGLTNKNVNLYSGTNLADVEKVFSENEIHIVIMGAGIDIEECLKIIRHIFSVSKNTTVHMKDRESGPAGMAPFVNGILGAIA